MQVRRLVEGPSAEVVTLAEQRAQSRVTSIEENAMIIGYMIAARQTVERTCGNALLNQTWELLVDYGWPCEWDRYCRIRRTFIDLQIGPVRSIESITYIDADGATQTLAVDQYRGARLNIENRSGLVFPYYGVSWPVVQPRPECITVRFIAGFGTNPGDVPEPIRQAIRLLAAHYYENREPVNIGNVVSELPLSVRSLLSDFVVGGSPDALAG